MRSTDGEDDRLSRVSTDEEISIDDDDAVERCYKGVKRDVAKWRESEGC